MQEKIIVIINPASGSTDEEFRPQIEKALQARGTAFEVCETTPQKGGDALAAGALQNGATHLIACGGDGTVMAVVNGLADHFAISEADAPPVTLSIVPGGTANLLATALQIPIALEAALEVALNGKERVIDLGRCGEHWFALGLGMGLTERLVSQTSAQEKERFGKLAYAWAMLKELGARPQTFEFKLDNQRWRRVRGVAVVVANAGTIGGGLRFAPKAKMDDGLLDLCVLHRFYFRDFVRMLARGLLSQLQRDRAVSFYQAARIEIRSNPPLDLQIDGEEVKAGTPLVAEVKPGVLRVRVPQDEAKA